MPREYLQRLGEPREEAEARALQCRFFVSWNWGRQGCREGPGVMGKTEPWLGHHLAIEKEKEKQPGFPLPLKLVLMTPLIESANKKETVDTRFLRN